MTGLGGVGHPLFIYVAYDVLICHIGPSKRGCRIIVVSKRVWHLGRGHMFGRGMLGGVGATPRGRGWGCLRRFRVVGCPA